jgi:hypothetical protein
MTKIRWLLAALGVALVSLVPVLGVRPGRRRPRHDSQVHLDDAGHRALRRHR